MYLQSVIPLIFIASVLLSVELNAQTTTLPVEAYSRLPEIVHPRISPDGKYLAATRNVNGTEQLVISKILSTDDSTPEKPMIVGKQGEFEIFSYDWASNDRLILTLDSNKLGMSLRRIASIDRTGGAPVYFDMDRNLRTGYRRSAGIIDLLENDNEHILAVIDEKTLNRPLVSKLNVYTGEKQIVEDNDIGLTAFFSDTNGEVRLGFKRSTREIKKQFITQQSLYYRKNPASAWEKLQELDSKDPDLLYPIRFDNTNPDILIVSTAAPDADPDDPDAKLDFYRYDLNKREIAGKYVDTRKEEILAFARQSVPGSEVEFVTASKNYERTIVLVYSDIIKNAYYIYDSHHNRFDKLAPLYPALEPAVPAPMEDINYTARDGLPIHAYLTRPINHTGKLPVVVDIHDGPDQRLYKGFEPWIQLLVSRGYAVFQPEFRGSLGHGIKHREAGNFQWGYAIQDDITDGVQWLIDNGIADPEKICITGNGFGGYSVAMGLIKTPNLCRCGVSYYGIYDLQQYIEKDLQYVDNRFWSAWNDTAKAVSPFHHAEEITKPLLMFGYELDNEVKISQSRKMHKRLKGLKKDVQYIEYKGVNPYSAGDEIRINLDTVTLEFLSKHLGSN